MEFWRSALAQFTSMKAHVLPGAPDLFRPCSLPFSPQQLVGRS